MRVLVKEPGKPAEVREIENTLEATQEIVEGFIEIVRLTEDVVLVVNEEGKINGMKPNFICCGDLIYGPAFFCGEYLGEDGGEFRGLTDQEVEAMQILFPFVFREVTA